MWGEVLCQIGFTDGETKVYLELLKIGSQPCSVVAKRLKVNRSSVYSTLKSLMKKGVVSCVDKDGVKLFSSCDPNSLVGYVDRRCRAFNYYRERVLGFVSDMRKVSDLDVDISNPKIRYYDGKEGVKTVMYDALLCSDIRYSFLPMHKWLKFGYESFLLDYRERRITKLGKKLKAITTDAPDVRAFFEVNYDKNSDLTEILYLRDPIFKDMFENQINIYTGKVAILHLEPGEEYGVIIEDETIFRMHKMIFDVCYKSLILRNADRQIFGVEV
ncbi:hypothetical protein KJ632_03470 [Patescibacteria group bacterium]|nr:hypothetical protein [Patescibacteria group bacterium]